MRRVMVRYKVKPDRAAENEELVRAVYEELRRTAPDGLRYATFRLDDGVSFVHIAETEDGPNPLAEVEAFARFQEGIARALRASRRSSRELHEVGSYRFHGDEGGADGAEPHRWSTSSSTPATCEGASAFYARAAALAHGADRRRLRLATTRSSWAAPSAAASSSARRAARCGCPTSRSTASTRSPTAPGASAPRVLLEPREGPAGWRSVVATPEGGEIAFWQPKARRRWGAP